MFSAFERLIAFRYLRARRKEGFVSVITGFSLVGIALGVATLIVVMAVMNGFRHELLSRILGVNGHITVQAGPGGMPDYEAFAEKLRLTEGVTLVSPYVEGQAMASANNEAAGVMVKGFRAQDLQAHALLMEGIKEGNLDHFSGKSVAMIGHRLASKLGVHVGEAIQLLSPQGYQTVAGLAPRVKTYEIVAIFDVGMFEYDAGMVYVPLAAAQLYFRYGKSKVSGLELLVDNPQRALEYAYKIRPMVSVDYRIFDWQRSNAHFFNALQVERNVMFLILTLIILIAAFNIISGLVMMVQDKGRDIAILRTMGATRRSVIKIFFLCGAAIGVVGTALGVVLGLSFAMNIESIRRWLEGLTNTELFAAEIYFLSKLPAIIDPQEVMAVAAIALVLSFLATLYPSWRAARPDPVEALRYE